MPSFDITCKFDEQEIDNALRQTKREIDSRFDFKGGNSSVDFDKTKKEVNITADDEMKLRSIHQILENKLAKRGVDCRILIYQKETVAAGIKKIIKQTIQLRSEIERDECKKITTKIKNLKIKVQAQIQNKQIRVTGKKIDDLQEVIEQLKQSDIGVPLDFINMRQ